MKFLAPAEQLCIRTPLIKLCMVSTLPVMFSICSSEKENGNSLNIPWEVRHFPHCVSISIFGFLCHFIINYSNSCPVSIRFSKKNDEFYNKIRENKTSKIMQNFCQSLKNSLPLLNSDGSGIQKTRVVSYLMIFQTNYIINKNPESFMTSISKINMSDSKFRLKQIFTLFQHL